MTPSAVASGLKPLTPWRAGRISEITPLISVSLARDLNRERRRTHKSYPKVNDPKAAKQPTSHWYNLGLRGMLNIDFNGGGFSEWDFRNLRTSIQTHRSRIPSSQTPWKISRSLYLPQSGSESAALACDAIFGWRKLFYCGRMSRAFMLKPPAKFCWPVLTFTHPYSTDVPRPASH